jgi:hypothetical protein
MSTTTDCDVGALAVTDHGGATKRPTPLMQQILLITVMIAEEDGEVQRSNVFEGVARTWGRAAAAPGFRRC